MNCDMGHALEGDSLRPKFDCCSITRVSLPKELNRLKSGPCSAFICFERCIVPILAVEKCF